LLYDDQAISYKGNGVTSHSMNYSSYVRGATFTTEKLPELFYVTVQ